MANVDIEKYKKMANINTHKLPMTYSAKNTNFVYRSCLSETQSHKQYYCYLLNKGTIYYLAIIGSLKVTKFG